MEARWDCRERLSNGLGTAWTSTGEVKYERGTHGYVKYAPAGPNPQQVVLVLDGWQKSGRCLSEGHTASDIDTFCLF